jgi:hypothetical protein
MGRDVLKTFPHGPMILFGLCMGFKPVPFIDTVFRSLSRRRPGPEQAVERMQKRIAAAATGGILPRSRKGKMEIPVRTRVTQVT